MKKKEYAVANEITGSEIKDLRLSLGLGRKDMASLLGVSVKTIEYWESREAPVTGPLVLAAKLLREHPQIPEELEIPEQVMPMRLMYMFRNEMCTLIDVDVSRRIVKIRNYTDRIQFRAFGSNDHPDYDQFMEFLRSRCFPETMDKIKLKLQALNLPFYDPLLIIEKTEGRMAEDDFYIRIIKNDRTA